MKKDIGNRADIKLLVDSFYDKVKKDAVIGYLFNEVAHVNWEHHLPRMYDFWENIIFQTGHFTGNPMTVHIQLNQQSPLTPEHFAQWQKLFLGTIDELFEGNNAELTKQRAVSIATVIQIKLIPPGNTMSVY